MNYKIVLEKKAEKFLLKQTEVQRKRLLGAIYHLPFEGDIKPMKGYDDLFRLRVGSYRILYNVRNDILVVQVIEIGNRGDIYK